jgi:hypothetical protein
MSVLKQQAHGVEFRAPKFHYNVMTHAMHVTVYKLCQLSHINIQTSYLKKKKTYKQAVGGKNCTDPFLHSESFHDALIIAEIYPCCC